MNLFKTVLDEVNVNWHHIKAHGALYNEMAQNLDLAMEFLEVIDEYPQISLIYLPAGARKVIDLFKSYNYTVWKEGLRRGNFAIVHRVLGSKDRRMVYAEDGVNDVETTQVSFQERREWSLNHAECRELAQMALSIEEHYGRPMDIEWAKDGQSGLLFIVQARPETVHAGVDKAILYRYSMKPALIKSLKAKNQILATGHAVGKRIGHGKVRTYRSYGEVLERKKEMQKRIVEGVLFDEKRQVVF